MHRLTSNLPTLGILTVVAALAAAAVLTYGGGSDSKGSAGSNAGSGGLMTSSVGPGTSTPPTKAHGSNDTGSDTIKPRPARSKPITSGPVAPHAVLTASAPSPGMPKIAPSSLGGTRSPGATQHAAPRTRPKAHAKLPTPRTPRRRPAPPRGRQPGSGTPRPQAPSKGTPAQPSPGATPTSPGAPPAEPGTTPPPATPADPDAGLDDTPAGGLDDTDLGGPIDETPAAAPAPEPAPAQAPGGGAE